MNGKKIGLIAGISAAALILIAGIIAAVVIFGKKPDVYRVIKVLTAEGHSYVTRGDIKDLEAYDGMALQSGDSIHVDGNSSLILMLDEDKIAYVEQNTDFKIIAEGTAKDSRSKILLERGALTCEIQNSLGSGSTYEVDTPNSTMAVMGTVFRTEVSDADTIREVLESGAIQPSMLFMGETLESLGADNLNTITRLTIADGVVKVQLHDENGNKVGDEIVFNVNTDVLIGGNDTQSSILEQITGLDLSTFPEITIDFFYDISDGSGKMIISGNDLKSRQQSNMGPHTVTFMYKNTVFGIQTVPYNTTPSEPVFKPTLTGGWDVDFTIPVTDDLIVYWKE